MSRDGMPRAYLRIDPNIDHTHPDIDRFIRLLCAAARQPDRGRFKGLSQLQAIFGKHHAQRLVDRGDVVTLPDGRLYVDGWDEWQEGDFTVAERMRRMRAKRRSKRDSVTVPALPGRNGVTTDAVDITQSVVTGVGDVTPQPPTSGGRRSEGTNPRAVADQERRDRLARRSARGVAYREGRLTEAQLDDMNERDTPLSAIPAERGAAYSKGKAS